MLAGEFLSHEVFPLKKTDTAASTRIFFEDWNVFHLPVVEEGKVTGFVSYDALTDASEKDQVGTLQSAYPFVLPDAGAHFFEIIRLFADTGHTALPVLDGEQQFRGIISYKDIFAVYKSSAMAQPGAIITFEMNARDYALGELSRIIEYNDVKILHLFVQPLSTESATIQVSVKLNTFEVKSVIISLERYGYRIKSVHQASEIDTDIENRYNWLIKYLNS